MAAASVTLTDEQMQKLESTAHRLGVSTEDLVLFSVDELLSRSNAFLRPQNLYLHKSSELYRHLV
jgi:hypothetical protein